MITFVNEELFNFAISKEISRANPDQTFFKMKVFTSSKIVRSNEMSIQNTAEPYIPVSKEIVSIIAPTEDFNHYNHSLNVNPTNPNYVTLKSHHKNPGNYDRNYFLIAIPFSGAMKPIPQSRDYSIYKGVIATSCRPFWFNGAKFRKVLYLLVEPNVNAFFNFDGQRKPAIEIVVNAVTNYRDRQDGGKEKSTRHLQSVTIQYDSTVPQGEYPIVATYTQHKEEYNHSLQIERYNTPMWVTTQAPNTPRKPYGDKKPYDPQMQQRRPYTPRPQQDKPQYRNDTPKPAYKKPTPTAPVKPEQDVLEDMIASSGMRDTTKMYRQNQYDRKKKKHK